MPDFLIDTNVLLRAIDAQSPVHTLAQESIAQLLRSGSSVFITRQIVIEFWSVATRPLDKNGCGLDINIAEQKVRALLTAFKVLDDKPDTLDKLLMLVSKYQIKGRKVHDTHLVACMLTHNLTNLLTFNVDDFKAFQEINAAHPTEIAPTKPD